MAQDLGLQSGIHPSGAGRLAEEVDNQGSFPQMREAAGTPTLDVLGQLGRFAGRQRAQQEQLVTLV